MFYIKEIDGIQIEEVPRISKPLLILADQSSGEGVTEISDFDRTRKYVDGVTDEEIAEFDRVAFRSFEKDSTGFHIELNRGSRSLTYSKIHAYHFDTTVRWIEHNLIGAGHRCLSIVPFTHEAIAFFSRLEHRGRER